MSDDNAPLPILIPSEPPPPEARASDPDEGPGIDPWPDAPLTARAWLNKEHKYTPIRLHWQRRCRSCGDMIPGFYVVCAACRQSGSY